ncbi:MAG: divergent polysaccharide deacetylase family protein, partial [Aliihoeflea sp.]
MLDFGDREIDRPLGLGPRPPRPRDGREKLRTLTVAGAACVLFALSLGSVLHDDGLRSPQPVVVATPVDEPSPDVPARPAGPSITRVDPTREPGQPGTVTVRDPTSQSQSAVTAHLPDPELIEPSDYGLLPRRDAEGRRPFDVYARPWSGTRGTRITIVVGGLGLSQTGTQRAIEVLPAEVTLAFAPAGNSLDRWMQN